jgi:hypothetical protein
MDFVHKNLLFRNFYPEHGKWVHLENRIFNGLVGRLSWTFEKRLDRVEGLLERMDGKRAVDFVESLASEGQLESVKGWDCRLCG